ncbi:MAG: NAD(P)H-dependent oxidoreductase subunit E [Anaerolineaceae bacterium]|nr:NAD(P)H-dependent oxidoreductase subunit E [Anaerolineaceae bacterium]
MSRSDSILGVDSLLAPYAGRGREALLPVLWDIQTAAGHISPEAVHAISHCLRVPEADIYGVIGFYSLFHAGPTGERIVRVCTDPVCGLRGGDALLEALPDAADLTIEHSPCLGLCEHAPAALVSLRGAGERSLAPVTDVAQLLDLDKLPDYPVIIDASPAVLLEGAQPHRVQTLAEYGDYAGLRRALELTPDEIVGLLDDSGLIGRGGAAFPTGRKWHFTRGDPEARHWLVCNADESEPGTFKDRALMEACPHRLLEGMAIAARCIGARHGYLFIRGEYPLATQRLAAAIAEAEAANLLGKGIGGGDFDFHIEIRRGAGAYICGEESALFEAIEGKRGFPRIKPPYPTDVGLFGEPTTVNNVETLAAVPGILTHGAAWFRAMGTEGSSGSKLVSVSGHVRVAGVYEIEPGISLRAFLEGPCGGVEGELQAVLMGGAAGTFLRPEQIDVKLSFEDLRAAGSTFGSGAIMVFNDTVDLRDVLLRLARFFQHESCGKCFPCQLGTQRQLELLERAPRPGDAQRLRDVGWTMTEASLCGLGQTAGSAVLSALEQWPGMFSETESKHG